MAFKEYDRKPKFLDMEIQRGSENSRHRQILSEIDETINWEPLEKIVTEHSPIGQSESGNKACPPLMLLKAMLIQKWFGIKSDTDLENQINASLTETETNRNKVISRVRYKIEQYFGITHKYHGAGEARFTNLLKQSWDHLYGAMAFNIKRVILSLRKQQMMTAT